MRMTAATTAPSYEVKGWCPGALRPMESGDGLTVRVRPRAGSLPVSSLAALAEAAHRHGNGLIDLTRRGNFQMRGITPATLISLHAVIASLDLLDESTEIEAIRNILVSPLAGFDPTEVCDVRILARQLEDLLVRDESLRRLPSKFGFAVDGGGLLPLDGVDADVRLRACRAGTDAVMAIGLARSAGVSWLGTSRLEHAAASGVAVARAMLKHSPSQPRRARALPQSAVDAIKSELALNAAPALLPALPPTLLSSQAEDRRRLGLLPCIPPAVGIGAAFGRVEFGVLSALATLLLHAGVREIRASPWRALYASVGDHHTGTRLLEEAARIGLIVSDGDPLVRVDACPGAPCCRATRLDTRADARRLAAIADDLAFAGSLHVSGCAKGCARSPPADLVLAGDEEGYRVIFNGSARDAASAFVLSGDIDDKLREVLRAHNGGNRV